jgi:hypothetical protein
LLRLLKKLISILGAVGNSYAHRVDAVHRRA